MNLLLIQKEGIDLYQTLLASETSRDILRFYRPERVDCGVIIPNSTLGGSLSLLAEIRWYIRRYVVSVLFEVSPDIYCSEIFAGELYGRNLKLSDASENAGLIGIKDGFIYRKMRMETNSKKEDYPDFCGGCDRVLEVRYSRSED
ncbi:DUF5804 family protein [Methanoplanus endosymbiosus]|uniref:DUF5804 family protein n=1 Tax=Methanoplanus endosymbiosus TaxID=33865 RepID=A0A9E7TN03_9EURY|nr:DUF5804 family protein [Methanoplanus endosymbiosus]UUX93886.1 DUF5804 family protein [Methanoplanus endosymbiosus]